MRGEIRRAGVGHKQELGAQKADPFRAALYRIGGVGGVAQVGGNLNPVAVAGLRLLEAQLPGVRFTLLLVEQLLLGAAQALFRRLRSYTAALAIQNHHAAVV